LHSVPCNVKDSTQEVQVVADPPHVLQLGSHSLQVELLSGKYHPSPHSVTHFPSLINGAGVSQCKQVLISELQPKQLTSSHFVHTLSTPVYLAGQGDVQTSLFGHRLLPDEHLSHVCALVQASQLLRQSLHNVPSLQVPAGHLSKQI